ncbi:hypothetical protein LTR84_001699 [Exophiala bonariae]|uniref:Uncharacterized protein n=1 Tax=Exophiala bonariae TaxID=1690606 RepID=A0AAV9NCE1_9EURO|nr:hypothetical protein LTR84_001699 [Exophiala bonariae]
MVGTTNPWKLSTGFESLQSFSRLEFNISYFDDLEKLTALQNGTEILRNDERQSLMYELLQSDDETPSCKPRAEKTESVLAGADVQILRQGEVDDASLNMPVAMVHEWSFTENCARSTSNNTGPKNSLDLYKSLREKVGSIASF